MEISYNDEGVNISILKEEISGTEISSSKEYGYASIRGKVADKDYFNIHYEFEKKDGPIPDFVVALMGLIKSMGEKASVEGAWEGKEEVDKEVEEYFKNEIAV